MNIEQIRSFCLNKTGATEGMPFGESTLVFYVGEKMFALIPLDEIELKINLKCDPERAIDLRLRWENIIPGFHMNKKHWNTMMVEKLPSELVYELIDHSYSLVLKGLTIKKRSELGL